MTFKVKSSEIKERVLVYCLLVKWQNILLVFQKFTSHWSRLTKHLSGTLLEPIRSLVCGHSWEYMNRQCCRIVGICYEGTTFSNCFTGEQLKC